MQKYINIFRPIIYADIHCLWIARWPAIKIQRTMKDEGRADDRENMPYAF